MRGSLFFFFFAFPSPAIRIVMTKGAARVSGSPRASVPFSATPVVEIAPQ